MSEPPANGAVRPAVTRGLQACAMHYRNGTAELEVRCPQCGASAVVHIIDSGFRWSASRCCTLRCGFALEEDGGPRIDGPYRTAVLQQSGTWQLWVPITAVNRMDAMRVFRDVLKWSVGRVSEQSAASPVLAWEGTAGETSWFAGEFEKIGVAVDIRPSPGTV